MPWKDTPKTRSLPCNGEMIRYYRQQIGWTQQQFSDRSGYSVRLIRKAEAGRPIHADTIEILADTFSSAGLAVTPEDLVSDPLAMAKQFCETLAVDRLNAAGSSRRLLGDDLRLTVAGDPDMFSFAGNFSGVSGYDDFLRRFYETMYCPDPTFWQPRTVAHGNEAMSWGLERMQVDGAPENVASIVIFRFTFERGKIVKIEDDYNTEASESYLRKHASHLFED